MTQIIVLPHVELCPEGAVIEAEPGKSICENLLANDIELDHSRSLAEHTHRVCDAGVVGSSEKFILQFSQERDHGWLLEIPFARGFKKYYPGGSTGLNSLRSVADIKHSLIHWRGNGREQFDQWLVREESENQAKGEWTEYKA